MTALWQCCLCGLWYSGLAAMIQQWQCDCGARLRLAGDDREEFDQGREIDA